MLKIMCFYQFLLIMCNLRWFWQKTIWNFLWNNWAKFNKNLLRWSSCSSLLKSCHPRWLPLLKIEISLFDSLLLYLLSKWAQLQLQNNVLFNMSYGFFCEVLLLANLYRLCKCKSLFWLKKNKNSFVIPIWYRHKTSIAKIVFILVWERNCSS
jgi:hypothetical protein